MSGSAIVVMAKAPVAGLAKTRLIPTLGAEGAATLAERMLAHAAQVAAEAATDTLEVCAAPMPPTPPSHSWRETTDCCSPRRVKATWACACTAPSCACWRCMTAP